MLISLVNLGSRLHSLVSSYLLLLPLLALAVVSVLVASEQDKASRPRAIVAIEINTSETVLRRSQDLFLRNLAREATSPAGTLAKFAATN